MHGWLSRPSRHRTPERDRRRSAGQPAEEAIADLARTMADLLDRMAAGSVNDSARAWLDQARALGNEIRRVDEALHLAAARDEQDRLSELLATAPAVRPVGWPLRGELISHLDRLRSELEAGAPGRRPRRQRNRSWRPRPSRRRVPPALRKLTRELTARAGAGSG